MGSKLAIPLGIAWVIACLIFGILLVLDAGNEVTRTSTSASAQPIEQMHSQKNTAAYRKNPARVSVGIAQPKTVVTQVVVK